jgi:hypothetical protein
MVVCEAAWAIQIALRNGHTRAWWSRQTLRPITYHCTCNAIRFGLAINAHQLLLLRSFNQDNKNTRIVAAACLSQSISASLSPKLTRPNEQRWILTMLRMRGVAHVPRVCIAPIKRTPRSDRGS